MSKYFNISRTLLRGGVKRPQHLLSTNVERLLRPSDRGFIKLVLSRVNRKTVYLKLSNGHFTVQVETSKRKTYLSWKLTVHEKVFHENQ